MVPFSVDVQDQQVQAAIQSLSKRVENMYPALAGLGEDMVERTKRRFDTSTDPDGNPWKPNADSTMAAFTDRLGKGYRKKNGELNAKGEARKAGKKPLIGESGDLRRDITARADANSLTMTASAIYAAIQHLGGKAGRGHSVSIPARPFMPVRADGTLYPYEEAEAVMALNQYLAGA